MVAGQVRSPGHRSRPGQVRSGQGKVKEGQGQVGWRSSQGHGSLRSSWAKIWSSQVPSRQGQYKVKVVKKKRNGAIWLLDPKNIVLDTKIIILCALVQKLWPNPNKHSWSAHPWLIGRCPEHFNSQLKFGRWSADVHQINSSAGIPRDTSWSPAGHRLATRGNLGCNWRKKTPQVAEWRSDVLRRDTGQWPRGDLPAT